jgi:hypothetical protein
MWECHAAAEAFHSGSGRDAVRARYGKIPQDALRQELWLV